MVADFMRYYTGTKISHFSRFHEISNSNLNISWLQFSWDITLCSQYLIVDDFMRYYNRTKISHVCRFHEIFHRNLNISWLHISRLRFRLAHHRTALRYFFISSDRNSYSDSVLVEIHNPTFWYFEHRCQSIYI